MLDATPEPLACLDAAYSASAASAACALFAGWDSPAPVRVLTTRQPAAAAYEPGAFYKRELSLLRAVLDQAGELPRLVIVDGYVWLDGAGRPGLGAMLYRALAEKVPVIGIAKTAFAGATAARAVVRGGSRRALYVTAAGLDPAQAAQDVLRMHGRHRIPTLLQLVDRAARAALA